MPGVGTSTKLAGLYKLGAAYIHAHIYAYGDAPYVFICQSASRIKFEVHKITYLFAPSIASPLVSLSSPQKLPLRFSWLCRCSALRAKRYRLSLMHSFVFRSN